MDGAARFVKVQLPNYLRSLPIPNNFNGFTQLTRAELVQLAPLVIVTSIAVYVVLSALVPSRKKKDSDWINKNKHKEKPKVADVVQIEDLGEKTAFCRCWKSQKFPYCDGSHNSHNKETGDNVGPLVIKGKPAAAS